MKRPAGALATHVIRYRTHEFLPDREFLEGTLTKIAKIAFSVLIPIFERPSGPELGESQSSKLFRVQPAKWGFHEIWTPLDQGDRVFPYPFNGWGMGAITQYQGQILPNMLGHPPIVNGMSLIRLRTGTIHSVT